MNIGDASERSGLPAKTIRHYENLGLVRPARRANGYRSFGEGDVRRLSFLARARALGFTLEECRSLTELWDSPPSPSMHARARRLMSAVDRKTAQLADLRASLEALTKQADS